MYCFLGFFAVQFLAVRSTVWIIKVFIPLIIGLCKGLRLILIGVTLLVSSPSPLVGQQANINEILPKSVARLL